MEEKFPIPLSHVLYILSMAVLSRPSASRSPSSTVNISFALLYSTVISFMLVLNSSISVWALDDARALFGPCGRRKVFLHSGVD